MVFNQDNMRRLSLAVLLVVVAACTAQKTSQDLRFAPLPKTFNFPTKDALHFLVVGDWGRNGDYHQRDVADQMNRYAHGMEPEFVISVGDNFYDSGVASTEDPLWMSSFEQVYSGGALLIPWYSILGNHDYHGNPQAQIDYSKKSQRWRMPARYFTLAAEIDDNTSARLVFLDTNPFVKKYQKNAHEYADVAEQDTRKQLAWLDSVLTASKEPWKIVIGHHPIYSSGTKHGNTPELIEQLKPILEKHGVQAYFCGHDHDLQHQKPEGSAIDYFVSGAGSDVRDTGRMAITRFAEAVQGFATVSLTTDTMMVCFVDYQGKPIYQYSKKR